MTHTHTDTNTLSKSFSVWFFGALFSATGTKETQRGSHGSSAILNYGPLSLFFNTLTEGEREIEVERKQEQMLSFAVISSPYFNSWSHYCIERLGHEIMTFHWFVNYAAWMKYSFHFRLKPRLANQLRQALTFHHYQWLPRDSVWTSTNWRSGGR